MEGHKYYFFLLLPIQKHNKMVFNGRSIELRYVVGTYFVLFNNKQVIQL